MKGKILLAKKLNTAYSTRKSEEEQQYIVEGRDRCDIQAGTLVLCIEMGCYHTIYIIHRDQIWAVDRRGYAVAKPSGKLKGKRVCFTGALINDRSFYKVLVELHGGIFAVNVTRRLNYLVVGYQRWSDRIEIAKSYGVPCISETEFLKMLNANS